MRKLTQQEIDNAPEWATDYVVKTNGVLYESKDWYQFLPDGTKLKQWSFGVCEDAKPIQ